MERRGGGPKRCPKGHLRACFPSIDTSGPPNHQSPRGGVPGRDFRIFFMNFLKPQNGAIHIMGPTTERIGVSLTEIQNNLTPASPRYLSKGWPGGGSRVDFFGFFS